MAFLGGLILNVMPCVLPILFLKFYNTLELKQLSPSKAVLLNISYSLGVIVSFLVLALFIFVSKKAGEGLGWGFHLQSPLFVSLLALLFTFMGFYLLGALSFSSPKKTFKLFKQEKFLSHFLTGVLSTTAASPCTVPFMAGAVGYAFSRSYLEIFSIFFFLGLGLSFPFLILSLFPRAFKYLPSPGIWSERLKKIFSIPLFLTSAWLTSILYLQVSLKVFLITLLVFPISILWIFFQKKSKSIKLLAGFIFFTTLTAIFSVQFILKPAPQNPSVKKSAVLSSLWQEFDENKIQYDKQQGRNVFIAFGAKWCLSCQVNERIFRKKAFQDQVKKHRIQLYYGDWTNKTDSISSFLESHSRQGVPFYIFYKGEEEFFIFSSFLLEQSFLKKLESLVQ